MCWVHLSVGTLLICCLDEQEDGKDTLGADSAMGYLQSVGVGVEDASLFLAVELLQAPSIGEISRAGFVNGWKEAGSVARIICSLCPLNEAKK